MIRSQSFLYITVADFIVRSAYQMGKTPLLPIYAAALGASDIFLGFIVAVSTLTGMVFKPLIGLLSDRWGRRTWLLVGTTFFTGMPFIYGVVDTPEQLFAIRIVHGFATAIYGPVTLAYVAELSQIKRAERLGWFSIARNSGYVIGPISAGWMLLTISPVAVFTIIGLLSSIAFIPILNLSEAGPKTHNTRGNILRQTREAMWSGSKTPEVWISGLIDAMLLIVLYATKTFLPIYALSVGISIFAVGIFFAVQYAVQIALTPIGGKFSDRLGHLNTIGLGIMVLAIGLILITMTETAILFLAPAILIGIAQALVSPSTVALLSVKMDHKYLGLGMGMIGTLKNAGKIIGPSLAGILVYWLDFTPAFLSITGVLLAIALIILSSSFYRKKHPFGKSSRKTCRLSSNG